MSAIRAYKDFLDFKLMTMTSPDVRLLPLPIAAMIFSLGKTTGNLNLREPLEAIADAAADEAADDDNGPDELEAVELDATEVTCDDSTKGTTVGKAGPNTGLSSANITGLGEPLPLDELLELAELEFDSGYVGTPLELEDAELEEAELV